MKEEIIQISATPASSTTKTELFILTNKSRIFRNIAGDDEWEEIELPNELL